MLTKVINLSQSCTLISKKKLDPSDDTFTKALPVVDAEPNGAADIQSSIVPDYETGTHFFFHYVAVF